MLAASLLVAANLGIVASYFMPCVPALLPRRVVSLPLRGPRTANLAGGGGSEWWEERGSVPFECSECGKCCKVRGDVWASPEDVVRLAAHLNIQVDDFAEKYGRLEVGKLLVCSFFYSPSISLTHGLSLSLARSLSLSSSSHSLPLAHFLPPSLRWVDPDKRPAGEWLHIPSRGWQGVRRLRWETCPVPRVSFLPAHHEDTRGMEW